MNATRIVTKLRGHIARAALLGGVASLAIGAPVTHELRPGETVYSVARDYHIEFMNVLLANEIADPRLLRVGTVLTLPGLYEVEPGDTLYAIARRFDTTVEAIRALNNLAPDDPLLVSDVLRIPDETHAPPRDQPLAQGPLVDPDDVHNAEASRGDGTQTHVSVAREPAPGTFLQRAPLAGGDSVLWPHDGLRYATEGKVRGVVIDAHIGDRSVAVASGRVVYAGPQGGLGQVVFVESPEGHVYVYGGNRSLAVEVGDLVEPRSVLGEVGPVPLSPDPVVYFAVWKDDRYVDPAAAPRE